MPQAVLQDRHQSRRRQWSAMHRHLKRDDALVVAELAQEQALYDTLAGTHCRGSALPLAKSQEYTPACERCELLAPVLA